MALGCRQGSLRDEILDLMDEGPQLARGRVRRAAVERGDGRFQLGVAAPFVRKPIGVALAFNGQFDDAITEYR